MFKRILKVALFSYNSL